eukprot:m.1300398 g.1300398  ORF g.1300398 m.1300398 type:complete len:595 (+) comp24803_c0_seq2:267-2051(+)
MPHSAGKLSHVALVVATFVASAAGVNRHKFKVSEQVPIFVNKVGPYYNTHETYHYYSLPVCHPEKIKHRSLTLGEVLDGDRMAESLYKINFREDISSRDLCTLKLNYNDVEKLRNAIEDLYYFEFVLDDLPVRGFIGQLEEQLMPGASTTYLWTHIHFSLQYNEDQIVVANVTEKLHEVELPELADDGSVFEVTFSYSATWTENKNVAFKARHQSDQSFFPKTLEIHWLSIINSAVLVLLLVGFVLLILTRMLNKDFAQYAKGEELDAEEDLEEDQGWKNLHTDVFRFPAYKSLLCAFLGNGVQFLTLSTVLILMALSGAFHIHHHGSMNTAGIMVYAFTCGIAGYVSNYMYKSIEGVNWVWNIIVTSCVFTLPFFVVWSTINTVAWYTGSTQALPFTTIILLMLIWLCVGFPLTVLGGILGKNANTTFDAPCRTKPIVREIPPIPCYRSLFAHMLIGGFLPFSSISVELYYIFATVWGREHYTLYGILLMVYLVLLAVTACISIALTYFQLSSEDHRWWWHSLFSAGSTSVFVLLYAAFYFHVRSNMTGPLQTVQFFGFTLLACYVFFLMLGTVGFYSSLHFVRYIYKNLKLD